MSILQEIVHQLIEYANATPNQWQSKRLARGLTVHIMNDVTAYKLVLSRTDKYPSPQEWKTVTNYWAYPIETPHFETDFKKGKYYLKGRIARQGTFV